VLDSKVILALGSDNARRISARSAASLTATRCSSVLTSRVVCDSACFRSLGIGALRRFASRRQALVARRTRGRNPPAGIHLGRSNEILETLLYGEQLPQSLVIGLVDCVFSHGTWWDQSRVVRDLAARLRRPQLLEPRQPPFHAFAGGR
jgi:hypothetical protein